jgi:two-component system CheB/CheR fusion protein
LRQILPYRAQDDLAAGVVITFTDITERRHAVGELEAAKLYAELANVAKSRFLASARHDLRQPLQSLTLLQGLLTTDVGGERSPGLVVRLGQTIAAMSSMLNALLDINQIEVGAIGPKPVDFQVNDIFDRLRDEFTYQANAKKLSLRIIPSTIRVSCGPILLEQLTRNLLRNALKYTATGKVLVGCRRRAGTLRIEIWDTGVGIAEEDIKAVFDEFHQVENAARERSRGLGLGLSIVQRLGDLLELDVCVRSTLGWGSVFSIGAFAKVIRSLCPVPGTAMLARTCLSVMAISLLSTMIPWSANCLSCCCALKAIGCKPQRMALQRSSSLRLARSVLT